MIVDRAKCARILLSTVCEVDQIVVYEGDAEVDVEFISEIAGVRSVSNPWSKTMI